MAVVGYANFSGWPSLLRARDDPHIACMAERYGRTSTQVIIRHCLQKGLAVIPASLSETHIKDNAQTFNFSLEEDDLAYLDNLANLASSERVPWLPGQGRHQKIFKVCP
jgi:diketogulonate reductase-like aldo/keto reductase